MIDTPLLTTNDCEGAGEAFRVQQPSDRAINAVSATNSSSKEFHLTVSSQLHLEAFALGLSKVS
ncbi:unnamed protein product [Protopolystoma xenopodis]|uniref:Uncharacterized protein n=1 Tax=Protopolystoma xenopodis TaxID=117903 RepID=A0A3S5CJH9_9PLAT|nr:unnamed protein product [Protopolystoma xenopodis]